MFHCGITRPLCFACFHSDYLRTGQNISEQYHDTEAGPNVYDAMWQLTLAMLAKGILTIFTFGMKVWLLLWLLHNTVSTSMVGSCWSFYSLDVCGGVYGPCNWNRNGTNSIVSLYIINYN